MTDTTLLARFLLDHGVGLVTLPDGRDLEMFRVLRSRLRAVFEADSEQGAVDMLNQLLATHRAVPHYTDHDHEPWHLHVTAERGPGVDQLAANAAMGLLAVVTSTGMQRLHTCEGNACAEVFVDTSRNQSRRYCSPLACGNRAHAANHRARIRARSARAAGGDANRL